MSLAQRGGEPVQSRHIEFIQGSTQRVGCLCHRSRTGDRDGGGVGAELGPRVVRISEGGSPLVLCAVLLPQAVGDLPPGCREALRAGDAGVVGVTAQFVPPPLSFCPSLTPLLAPLSEQVSQPPPKPPRAPIAAPMTAARIASIGGY